MWGTSRITGGFAKLIVQQICGWDTAYGARYT